jgi:hypothetical protein
MAVITLDQVAIQWAVGAADESMARWASAPGHYRNQWTSHLVGRLGEIAAEQFLMSHSVQVQAHFRCPERESLCDIELLAAGRALSVRLDVKTWSQAFWPDLGRCIAVNQLQALEHKAEGILWCILHESARRPRAIWQTLIAVRVSIAGYSTMSDVRQAPIRLTGRAGMPKVKNHQIAELDLRPSDELVSSLIRLKSEKSKCPNLGPSC